MSGQGILDRKAGFRRRCRLHPWYKARFQPTYTNSCPGCWYMFLIGGTEKASAKHIGEIHKDWIDVVEACDNFKED